MASKRIVALLAFVLVASLVALPAAQTLPQTFCNTLFPASPATAMENVVGISFMIILLVLSVVGIVYMLGYSFGISGMVAFSRSEIGEAALTIVIIAVFSTFIYAANSTAVFSIPGVSRTSSASYFTQDCEYLSVSSVNVLAKIVSYYWVNVAAITLVQNVKLSYMPVNFGVRFSPLLGLNLINLTVNRFSAFASFIAVLLIGVVGFLAIVYAIFPIFLYAGIVLRTIPFTRAAGGAMLGFFIGFYLMFPGMLYFMLSTYPGTAAITGTMQTATQSVSGLVGMTVNGVGDLMTELLSAVSTIGIHSEIQNFTNSIIDPMFYTIFSIVISIVVSYDFSEMISGLLGSPSLRSRQVFKRIL